MPSGFDLATKIQVPLSEKWGYIFGTSGQVWTQAAQDRITKEKAGNPNYKLSIEYGSKWIGRRVTDCSGLILWLLSQWGIRVPHGSNSIWKNGYLSKKGAITGDIPVGALVFKLRGENDYHHVGVYIGDGNVVESQGTRAGVVLSKLSTWTHYGLVKGVSYGESPRKEVIPLHNLAYVDVPTGQTLNMRDSPQKGGRLAAKAQKGTELEVLSVDGEWAKVRLECYVMTKFLREKA